MNSRELAPGVIHYPAFLDGEAQAQLLDTLRGVVQEAPLFTPRMPRTGKSFSVRMSNCGRLGWTSDEAGYRYTEFHPETGKPWPTIPPQLLAAWKLLSGSAHIPDACLINFYDSSARMGLHQDRDEETFDLPVVSLSLGDSALFRYGGLTRNAPTASVKLLSGDALVFGGQARLMFHGIDRIYPGTSNLLPQGGRVNLTLRKVTRTA